MKILLTGANGFLGKSISNELLKDNTLYTLSKTSGDYMISLENEIPDFNQNFELVIHAAGKAHGVPITEEEKQKFYNINVEGTRNLLKGLEKMRVPKQFVFISSVSVYGQESGKDIHENHPLLAKDTYGLSKIVAEELIIKWCSEQNVVCTVLRLPLLIGENPPGNLGAMIKGIHQGYYFNISGGQARKSMVLAKDIAKVLVQIASIGGVYNLTDGYHPNFYELSNAISKQYGKSRIFNLPFFMAKSIALVGDTIGTKFPLDSKKLRKITSDLTFDDSKARQFLEWNPSNVLDFYKK